MAPITIVRSVDADGRITLENLPVRRGDRVEVTITVLAGEQPSERYPLRCATPYRFDDHFTPAVREDD